ncbi:MAG: LysR substrate-binding domain-containing protein [Kiloniellales bacterium]|jgi:DNA-binding transcriptional LysR family regulator|nr:LysR substrate-binding domain-containing protein [Kiloniellales bacterium]
MTARLESDLLRTFAAIADSGGFTRAAELVGRTQSALSLQMKKLEETVGQPLFLREARGVRLTAAGEDLLIRARPILRQLDRAAENLRGGPVEGAVRVGVPEEYGASLLPGVLARFAERHPGVQVTVRCETSLSFAPALARGELDLAVMVSDRGAAQGEILLHDPTVWVTSARHLTHERDPLPLALFDSGCWWRDWSLRALDDAGLRYRIAYSSASVAGIQAAVGSGLAVGVLGQSTLPPGTRRLSAAEGFRELPASTVVLRTAGGATDAVRSMAAAIREAFRGPAGASRAA